MVMIYILGSLLFLLGVKEFNFHSFGSVFSRRLIVGPPSCFPQGKKKFLLNQFCKPFQRIPCLVLKFLFIFARILRNYVLNAGDDLLLIGKVGIGILGHLCANKN